MTFSLSTDSVRGWGSAALRAAGWLEWLLMGLMLAALWMPDFNRVWALLLAVPMLGIRLLRYRRLWPRTPLDVLALALLALLALSALTMPFRQGVAVLAGPGDEVRVPYEIIVIGRPLFGVLLMTSLIEAARRAGSMHSLLWASVALGVVLGLLGLFAAQYTEKSDALQPIVSLLPAIRWFPGAEGGFNVNEIAGGMAWFTPLMAGIAIWAWREVASGAGRRQAALASVASLAFALLWAALFLGQSRSAIIGVLPGLLALSLLLRGRWRVAAVAFVVLFAGAQIALLIGPRTTPGDALQQRDAASASSRVLIWQSALAIIRDHPLTGAGMNNFRAPVVRAAYPVAGYEQRVLPHAHNEIVQLGVDFGLPGVLLWLLGAALVTRMLWQAWRAGLPTARPLLLGVAAGLAAHALYGLGDAIPLWDRQAFGLWWMLGLAGALWLLRQVVAGDNLRIRTTPSLDKQVKYTEFVFSVMIARRRGARS